MFEYFANRVLSAIWPWRPQGTDRLVSLGRRRESRWPFYVVCTSWTRRRELDAPAPLHLVGRLILWPFALVDWVIRLPRALAHFLWLGWRVPNPTFPWPPLP